MAAHDLDLSQCLWQRRRRRKGKVRFAAVKVKPSNIFDIIASN